ncbi:MAG: AI-2E family transporter [Ruminococcaceae bacterium]|nr:AI-2E family transporter [Oscillospiraceae bacterium]
MKNKRYFLIGFYAFLTFVACLMFYTLWENSEKLGATLGFWMSILTPFAWGFVLAYVINFLLKFFEKYISRWRFIKKPGHVRALSLVVAYLGFFILIALVLLLIVPQLVTSISGVVSQYDAASINRWVKGLSDGLHALAGSNTFLLEQIDRFIPALDGLVDEVLAFLPKLVPEVFNFVSGVTSGLSNFMVGMVVSVYLLFDKEKLCARVKKLAIVLFGKKRGDYAIGLAGEINETVGDFLSGKLTECLIMGLFSFVAMLITGIKLPVLLAVILGLSNIVPFFGPIIGAIIGGVILVLVDPSQLLLYIIVDIIIQNVDGNIVGPRILGKSTGLSGLWIIVAILLGGGLFGFWGMLLGVPVFAILYAFIREFVAKRLKEMELSPATSEYVDYKGAHVDLVENNSQRPKKPSKLLERIKKWKNKKQS